MITDADVTKLKKTFLTKVDIAKMEKTFATKADIAALEKRMDEKFVTKKEFSGLVVRVDVVTERLDVLTERVDGLTEKVGDMSVEIGEIHEKIDGLDVKFDAMLGLLTDGVQEHAVGAVQYARHDRQIKALATATNTVLPD